MGMLVQVLSTGAICFLCVSVGVMFAWPSSTIMLFQSPNSTLHRPMTETELSLFGSLSSISSLVGVPIAGILLDKIGRKYTSILGALMNVLCWAIIAASTRVEAVLTSVFISGLGGCVYIVVPIYISEMCQESIRGAMTSGSMVFYGLGMLLSYLLGGCLDYFTMIYVSLAVSIVGMALIFALKESPVYLMMKGAEEEAARTLAYFRGAKVDDKSVVEELNTIRRLLDPDMDTPDVVTPEAEKLNPMEKPVEKLSVWRFIRKSRSTRRALYVTLIIITASVFQGLVVLQVYAEPLFAEAIPTVSPTVCSVVLAVVGVIAGFVAAYLIEKAGRKALLVYSSIGSGVCCVLLGSQIQVHWGPHWLTAVIIYLFTVVYTAGAGTVPFVISAEIFLPEVKSFASMLVMEWMTICFAVILFIFNPLLKAIGLGPLFYIFAVVCFFTAIFSAFFLPETKGLSLEEIQTAFNKKKRTPSKFDPEELN